MRALMPFRRAFVAGLVILAMAGCVTRGPHRVAQPTERQFHIRDGHLMRGDERYVVKAFEAEGVGAPGANRVEEAVAFNRSAEVGGNSVCFDITGVSEDGKSLDKASFEAVKALSDWAHDRRMTVVARVVGANAPTCPRVREATVRTVANAFKQNVDIVFLIEGDDSAKLAKAFRRVAPKVVLVAPEGGVVKLVASSGEAKPGTPVFLAGAIPAQGEDVDGYILPPKAEVYAALDKALADPSEAQPWSPDNSALSEEERKGGWIAMFDGHSFNGWVKTGDKDTFVAHDGVIEWQKKGDAVLRSHDRYDNFELHFEYQIVEGGNSGVFLRAPREARQSRVGFEFQILGDYGKPSDKNSTGSVYDVVPPRINASRPSGEWNTVDITLDGPRYKAILNGEIVQDLSFDELDELKPRLRKGFICLQDHAHHVVFRNIRVRPIPAKQ